MGEGEGKQGSLPQRFLTMRRQKKRPSAENAGKGAGRKGSLPQRFLTMRRQKKRPSEKKAAEVALVKPLTSAEQL